MKDAVIVFIYLGGIIALIWVFFFRSSPRSSASSSEGNPELEREQLERLERGPVALSIDARTKMQTARELAGGCVLIGCALPVILASAAVSWELLRLLGYLLR